MKDRETVLRISPIGVFIYHIFFLKTFQMSSFYLISFEIN